MSSRGVLLRAKQGKDGDFPDWLEKLGLKDFLSHYPLRQLVEWGWLVPKSRVVFQKEFFLAWDEFPTCCNFNAENFEEQSILWDSSWLVDDKETLWFLDPFFRPDDEIGKLLLAQGASQNLSGVPEEFIHQRGIVITPYVDYFFHWQGYALIDIIGYADCFGPVLASPGLKERLTFIEKCRVDSALHWNPEEILILPTRWGGLAEPMTWLSHYRAFRDVVSFRDSENELLRRGALELAAYLGLSEEKLAATIKEKLLVLAQDWRWKNDRHCSWTRKAYPYLQADIYMAVEWLCYLSGKTLDYYFEVWSYDTLGPRLWAELHAVLEYDYFSERKLFLKRAPEYFNEYCKPFSDGSGLNGDQLHKLVDAIRATNYPFHSFLGAFRQMHEEMTYHFEHKGGLDFRERRPLDYYLLLAIRAEGCLRYSLEKDGSLNSIAPKKQGLSKYIECLAQRRGMSSKAIELFRENLKVTRLHESKEYPIASIMKLNMGLSERENYLIQAFLCCELARNYFAHHYCFDKEVRKSKESGFMLTGILVTVLYLLEKEGK